MSDLFFDKCSNGADDGASHRTVLLHYQVELLDDQFAVELLMR